MLGSIVFLAISLLLILLAAEGFTNGVEVFGKKYSLSQAVVGSILAAVGTALPETILPMVAIFSFGHASAKEIGVGAILGAPFMLSTLAFFLIGLTALISFLKKKRKFKLHAENRSTRRDLAFFIPMYTVAVFVPLFTGRTFAVPIAVLLIAGYVYYVTRTVRGESAGIEHFEGLHLSRFLKRHDPLWREKTHIAFIVLQVVGSLCLMVVGARVFVGNLEHISYVLGMSPLLFALILAPIATELPEKFNSVTWTLKGKDSLAIGNITGAMVFQSTFPVSVGLIFTDWQVTGLALVSAVISLLSASLVLISLVVKKRISPVLMLTGGALYLVYIVILIVSKSF
jgi:cation:H+ antiporter